MPAPPEQNTSVNEQDGALPDHLEEDQLHSNKPSQDPQVHNHLSPETTSTSDSETKAIQKSEDDTPEEPRESAASESSEDHTIINDTEIKKMNTSETDLTTDPTGSEKTEESSGLDMLEKRASGMVTPLQQRERKQSLIFSKFPPAPPSEVSLSEKRLSLDHFNRPVSGSSSALLVDSPVMRAKHRTSLYSKEEYIVIVWE